MLGAPELAAREQRLREVDEQVGVERGHRQVRHVPRDGCPSRQCLRAQVRRGHHELRARKNGEPSAKSADYVLAGMLHVLSAALLDYTSSCPMPSGRSA